MNGDAHRALDKEVQGEDADSCGEEAPPEDRSGIERDTLLHREQETTDG